MTAHDHGPYDCIPIPRLEEIVATAESRGCSLRTAACYDGFIREMQRQYFAGEIEGNFGFAIVHALNGAYRRGELWAADWLRSGYAPYFGDQWRDELIEVAAVASEVDGDEVMAMWAYLDAQEV